MDPDANLKEQRELIAKMNADADACGDGWIPDAEDTRRLLELSGALDEWLAKGGYLPEPWVRAWQGVRS